MKKNNTKFEILRSIDEVIKEQAYEIFSGLDSDERGEEAAELAERYEEEITEAAWQHIDNLVMYYTDAAEIVADFGYYTGWEDLQLLSGELPNNISQLAFAVIYEQCTEDGILYGYSWAFEEAQSDYYLTRLEVAIQTQRDKISEHGATPKEVKKLDQMLTHLEEYKAAKNV